MINILYIIFFTLLICYYVDVLMKSAYVYFQFFFYVSYYQLLLCYIWQKLGKLGDVNPCYDCGILNSDACPFSQLFYFYYLIFFIIYIYVIHFLQLLFYYFIVSVKAGEKVNLNTIPGQHSVLDSRESLMYNS